MTAGELEQASGWSTTDRSSAPRRIAAISSTASASAGVGPLDAPKASGATYCSVRSTPCCSETTVAAGTARTPAKMTRVAGLPADHRLHAEGGVVEPAAGERRQRPRAGRHGSDAGALPHVELEEAEPVDGDVDRFAGGAAMGDGERRKEPGELGLAVVTAPASSAAERSPSTPRSRASEADGERPVGTGSFVDAGTRGRHPPVAAPSPEPMGDNRTVRCRCGPIGGRVRGRGERAERGRDRLAQRRRRIRPARHREEAAPPTGRRPPGASDISCRPRGAVPHARASPRAARASCGGA